MRTVVFTDVHGCCREMKELLEKVSLNEGEDNLVFLGDMFDRGSDSYGVFLEMVRLKKTMGDRFTFILGNHDDFLLTPSSFFKKVYRFFTGYWLTLWSFSRNGGDLEEARDWLDENTVVFSKTEEANFVHAGVGNCPLEENSFDRMVGDHFIARKNIYQGKLTVAGHIHLLHPTYFDGSGKAGIRLSYEKKEPLPKTGLIDIDTGCSEGGCLTGMVIEDGFYTLYRVRRSINPGPSGSRGEKSRSNR